MFLFVSKQQFVLKAAGMGGSVWLQESAAVLMDGWVVRATPVSSTHLHTAFTPNHSPSLNTHYFFIVFSAQFITRFDVFCLFVCPTGGFMLLDFTSLAKPPRILQENLTLLLFPLSRLQLYAVSPA